MSINRVVLTGNLTRDPELRATPSGVKVMRVGIAVSDRVRDPKTGEWTDRPNFIDLVIFGERGESLATRLSKGQKVAVEGRLRYSSWETKEGARRSKIEVVVDEVEFMTRQGEAPSAPADARPDLAAAQAAGTLGEAPEPMLYDEDVPF